MFLLLQLSRSNRVALFTARGDPLCCIQVKNAPAIKQRELLLLLSALKEWKTQSTLGQRSIAQMPSTEKKGD